MPPQTVHRVAGLLEKLMAEDAEAGRPLLAALCVGRLRHGLPAPGFFMAAEALRLFEGGPAARDFHTRELACAFDYYRPSALADIFADGAMRASEQGLTSDSRDGESDNGEVNE